MKVDNYFSPIRVSKGAEPLRGRESRGRAEPSLWPPEANINLNLIPNARVFDGPDLRGQGAGGQDAQFGAEFDFFEREDGYPGLKKVYGFDFKKLVELDINLKYKAMEGKEVDVINSFSTDSLIKKYDLVTLQDDKDYFPSYNAGFVIKKETLKKYPEIKPLIEKLNGMLDDETMTNLNYQVEVENKNPQDVARKFLEEKGLIK